MLFERSLHIFTLQATRRLSRFRATTILSIYAVLAFIIALLSYILTFQVVLHPLASLLFTLTGRTPAPLQPRPPGHPLRTPSYAYGALIPNRTAELERRRTHVNYGSLPMRRPEADLLLSYLKPGDTYLEFGASGTTLAFPMLMHASYVIEHDTQVCSGIAEEMHKHPALSARLRAFCAPVPPGRADWALVSPFEEGSYRAFHNYVDFPRANLSELVFDKVLLNGRARVACALRILPQLREHSLVFFHDFFLRPAHYASVLAYYEEVARVAAHAPVTGYSDDPMGLLVLRPRREYVGVGGADVSPARVNALYDAYHEVAPSDESASLETAFRHGLARTGESGFAYYEVAERVRRETLRMRVVLDVLMLPFIVATYMVLRAVFRKVFAEALSSGGRGARLFAGDIRAAVHPWGGRSSSTPAIPRGKPAPVPTPSKTITITPPLPPTGKAE